MEKKEIFKINNNNIFNILLSNNKIIIHGKYGYFIYYLPKNYLIKKENNYISLLINNKKIYITVLKHFLYLYLNIIKLYYFKIKLRGLGYRIKIITDRLYKFFFTKSHIFYFYIPNFVYIKKRKRHLIFFSSKKNMLNNLFAHLLRLKKLDFYERNNSFIVKKKILFIKKRK